MEGRERAKSAIAAKADEESALLINDRRKPAGNCEGGSGNEEKGKSKPKHNLKILLPFCVLTVVANVAQTVTLKQTGNAFPTYPYFVFLSTAVPFVVVFVLAFLLVWASTKQITPEMRSTRQYKFFAVGALTALNGALMLFSNAHVAGVLQALLGPTIVTIPLSMLFSFLLMKRTYSIGHVLAVVLIIGGVLVAILPPSLANAGGEGGEGEGGSTENAIPAPVWAILFLCGSIPLALANVYEEKAFDESPIHIALMLANSVIYQFIVIVACAPLDFIPAFGSSTPSTFLPSLGNATACLFSLPSSPPECERAWLPWTLFVISYLLANFSLLGVVKFGNAVFAFVTTTLVVPLSEFAFAMPLIMGDEADTLHWYNYVSLVILIGGVIVYRVFDVREAKKAAKRAQLADSLLDNSLIAAPSYLAGFTFHLPPNSIIKRKGRANWTI